MPTLASRICAALTLDEKATADTQPPPSGDVLDGQTVDAKASA